MTQTSGNEGFGAAQLVVLLVPIIAGCFLLAGYLLSQIAARNERRARTFAEALSAIENYLEMPYRIRRRPASDAATRAALTNQMSDIKAQIAFHQAWLQVETPRVAEAFDAFVEAAKQEAGRQMMEAWRQDLLQTDAEMNLGVAYERSQADAARAQAIRLMRQEATFPRWRAPSRPPESKPPV